MRPRLPEAPGRHSELAQLLALGLPEQPPTERVGAGQLQALEGQAVELLAVPLVRCPWRWPPSNQHHRR